MGRERIIIRVWLAGPAGRSAAGMRGGLHAPAARTWRRAGGRPAAQGLCRYAHTCSAQQAAWPWAQQWPARFSGNQQAEKRRIMTSRAAPVNASCAGAGDKRGGADPPHGGCRRQTKLLGVPRTIGHARPPLHPCQLPADNPGTARCHARWPQSALRAHVELPAACPQDGSIDHPARIVGRTQRTADWANT